jgi:hypothetical protein
MTRIPIQLFIKRASIPTAITKTAETANTEYSFTLPPETKKFIIKARDGDFNIGFVSGNRPFQIVSGGAYWEDNLELTSSITIYYSSNVSGATLEIVYWV